MEGSIRMSYAGHAATIISLCFAVLVGTAAGAEESDPAAAKVPVETPQADAANEKAESEKAAPAEAAPAKAAATKTTASGMKITMLRVGTGASPNARDRVVVHYHGTFEDGKVFDSSVDRGKPAVFPLNRVIRCWTEGLQLMKVGGKARLVCPPKIAYGPRGKPPKIPKNATLTFEVELLEIK
jgi:FKBP-type peptidyl-prolyl cis-trans isomerase